MSRSDSYVNQRGNHWRCNQLLRGLSGGSAGGGRLTCWAAIAQHSASVGLWKAMMNESPSAHTHMHTAGEDR